MATDGFSYWLDGIPILANGLGGDFSCWLEGVPVVAPGTTSTPIATLSMLALVQRDTTQTLGLMAGVLELGAALLNLSASVQTQPIQLLNLLAAVQRVRFEALGLSSTVLAAPLRTLGLNSQAAHGISTPALSLLARASASSDAVLGLDASVLAQMVSRLSLLGIVSAPGLASLGVLAEVAPGMALQLLGMVSRDTPRLLGLLGIVSRSGEGTLRPGLPDAISFFPDDDRIYEGWGHSAPSEAVARYLTEAETRYLVLRYVNYPAPVGRADVAWLWDNTYLPVNAAELRMTEPVRETVFDTVAARTIVISETERDTPRSTRLRQFEITFPPVGIQFVKWLQMRLRAGTSFFMEIHLFDVLGDDYEEAWSEPTESTYLTWYWGTFPSWRPGSLRVKVNGSPLTTGFVAHDDVGAVEFTSPLAEGDVVLVQYAYRPKVEVVGVQAQPRAGQGFGVYAPKVVLVEVGS